MYTFWLSSVFASLDLGRFHFVFCLSSPMVASSAKMDVANKAICWAMRNPPKGVTKMKYHEIVKLVKKTNGRRPTIGAHLPFSFFRFF